MVAPLKRMGSAFALLVAGIILWTWIGQLRPGHGRKEYLETIDALQFVAWEQVQGPSVDAHVEEHRSDGWGRPVEVTNVFLRTIVRSRGADGRFDDEDDVLLDLSTMAWGVGYKWLAKLEEVSGTSKSPEAGGIARP
jgi:hypothetical protein